MSSIRSWFLRPFLGLFVFGALAGPCCSIAPTRADAAEDPVEKVYLDVQGMTCTSCEPGVKGSMKCLPGIRNIEVSFQEGRAVVARQGSTPTDDEIVAAIGTAGGGKGAPSCCGGS